MPHRIPPELCIKCKGYKRLCGLPRCPILERFQAQARASTLLSPQGELDGLTPPGALVGEHGYPSVTVYFSLPPTRDEADAAYREAPPEWARRREPLRRIIELRAGTPAATLRTRGDPWRLYELELTPAALSERPVDSEAKLARPPTPRLRFDGVTKPVGPAAPAERLRVTGAPRLHPKVESAIWDDTRASDAVAELYLSGVDVYTIQRAFSLGALGRLRGRRLVPTRWAITAVDDIIAGLLREKLRGRPWIDRVELYVGDYLGNRFTIILYPGPGSFEWIEVWHPRGLWTGTASAPTVWRVTEDARGRTSTVDGGFSAARTAVLEYLARRGRRADVIILREVTPSYYAPVGNWHIRETVRLAMERGPRLTADNLEEASTAALSRLEAGKAEVLRASPLLRGVRQRRITEFMS